MALEYLSNATKDAAVTQLRKRLPRLLFAALDTFPVADGLEWSCSKLEDGSGDCKSTNHRRIVVIAVRSLPAEERLDSRVASLIEELARGTRRPMDQNRARQITVTVPGLDDNISQKVDLIVNWHDCVDFNRLLLKGQPGAVEAMAHSDDSSNVLYVTDDWRRLRADLASSCGGYEALVKSKGYLKACFGAARSLLWKAEGRKKSKKVDKEDKGDSATCEGEGNSQASTLPVLAPILLGLCFRVAAASDQPCLISEVKALLLSSRRAHSCELKKLLQDLAPVSEKAAQMPLKELTTCIDQWCKQCRAAEYRSFVAELPAAAKLPPQQNFSPILDEWLQRLSASGYHAAAASAPTSRAWAPSAQLVEDAEERNALAQVESMLPPGSETALLIQTGSFMYDLQVESSDRDFSLVFLTPPEALLDISPPCEEFSHHVNRGFGSDKHGDVEYAGRELGSFVGLLAKGNPKNVELLFSCKPAMRGWAWQELCAARACFLTLRCCCQYLGFISDRLNRLSSAIGSFESEAKPNSDAESLSPSKSSEVSKLLYHAHHKMADLQRLLQGGCPTVALTGEERERVLKFRLQRPQTFAEARQLHHDAEIQRAKLSEQVDAAVAEGLLPAEVEAAPLLAWLRSVRVRSAIDTMKGAAEKAAAGIPTLQGYPKDSSMPETKWNAQSAPLSRTRSENEEQAIVALLEEVAVAKGIRIVVAGYGISSRVLGTSHASSDHDVKCIFVHKREKYFGLQQRIKTFKHQFPRSAAGVDVEISGWDVQHALQMLSESNPSVLGLLLSPKTFIGEEWQMRLAKAASINFQRGKLMHYWYHHGKNNYKSYIKSTTEPLRKKYVHVLRPLLSMAWQKCQSQTSQSWPPLRFADLVEALAAPVPSDGSENVAGLSGEEVAAVTSLLRDPEELALTLPRVPALDALIERLLKHETPSPCDQSDAKAVGAFETWHKLCIELVSSLAPVE
eukprot:TRINITY_DN18023_c0_g1_i3.p1 TRINITY_DN18023_c0_g1~~TRINITY_DN18023_c0_g1_i3.p1  ORF type:complete len:964 (+),score=197.20 TRINITY_DN18023_c0_g1_i3:47-2938(+)